MVNLESLVSFHGNYIIQDTNSTRIEMNLKLRIGIVITVKQNQAWIFSNNEICIVSIDQPDSCLINTVQRIDQIGEK